MGEECYSKCNEKQGKCVWCGEGLCCRKGFQGGGCDGSFGGQSNHQCVTKPPGDKISYILLSCPSKGTSHSAYVATSAESHGVKIDGCLYPNFM